MASERVSVSFPQRKRVSHQPKVTTKSSTTKTTPISQAQRDLDILKKFDLTLEYGPCIGITRLERWERAEKHGLNPSAEVKRIINKYIGDEIYTEW